MLCTSKLTSKIGRMIEPRYEMPVNRRDVEFGSFVPLDEAIKHPSLR